jgi:alpha-glucoside transport system permease protein
MSTTATSLPTTSNPPVGAGLAAAGNNVQKKLTSPWASVAAVLLGILWTLPTFGLLVTSFRDSRDIRRSGWWESLANPSFTLENYETVLGSTGSSALGPFFVNSFVITLPCVLIPLCLASLAAYTLAWIEFPGRGLLFTAIFALQIVPIQVTLLPLLNLFVETGLNKPMGGFWPLWLSHSTFALPLAIFLLHNFMKEVPRELLEAARVDGAGHVTIFFKVLLPLLKPALAAFGIFQFLWVWNDLLVGITFAGDAGARPLTVALANLSGTRGTQWHLLSAGAFVSIIVPVIVFLSLQRYFVRGLLAGGLKG